MIIIILFTKIHIIIIKPATAPTPVVFDLDLGGEDTAGAGDYLLGVGAGIIPAVVVVYLYILTTAVGMFIHKVLVDAGLAEDVSETAGRAFVRGTKIIALNISAVVLKVGVFGGRDKAISPRIYTILTPVLRIS